MVVNVNAPRYRGSGKGIGSDIEECHHLNISLQRGEHDAALPIFCRAG